jgi:hypothetical protein
VGRTGEEAGEVEELVTEPSSIRAVQLVPHPLQAVPTSHRVTHWRQLSVWPVIISATPAPSATPAADPYDYARDAAKRLSNLHRWTTEILAARCLAGLTAAAVVGGGDAAPAISRLVLFETPHPDVNPLPVSHFLGLYPDCTADHFPGLFAVADAVDRVEVSGDRLDADEIVTAIWPEFERAALAMFGDRLPMSARVDPAMQRKALDKVLEIEKAYLRYSFVTRHYRPTWVDVPITLVLERSRTDADVRRHERMISKWSEICGGRTRVLWWDGPLDNEWEARALDEIMSSPDGQPSGGLVSAVSR